MRRTRSSTANNPPSSSMKRRKFSVSSDDDDNDTDNGESPALQAIHSYLGKLTTEFSAVKDEIRQLKRRNEVLDEELARSKDQAKTSRSGGTKATSELQLMVNHLKAEIRKKEKIIKKLRDKELKREAEELNDDTPDPDTGEDQAQKMRKLLRRFNDLMMVTTLGDEDECPICMEKMKLGESSAFGCQHIVCNDCFKGILPKGEDEGFTCPVCRQKTTREEIELVHMSEQARWDGLLRVAEAWAAIDDHWAGVDTSEEEDEESFMVDTTSVSSEVNDGTEEASSPPANHRSYAASPSKDKRKRLAQLAKEREQKRVTRQLC